MLSAYANCLRIPELKKRIFFTFAIIALVRVTSTIPCPGVDPEKLAALFKQMSHQTGGGFLAMFNMFSGGAVQRFAVGALGIMPYISASIIVQMMTPVLPALEKLSREGESGRQKMNQVTRYVTLTVCVIQGVIYSMTMMHPERIGLPAGTGVVVNPGLGFMIRTVITLTAGSMLIMWMGEKITERGVGRGASLIITVNILARLPAALGTLYKLVRGGVVGGQSLTPIHVMILFAMFFIVCACTVAITQGNRKIPIRYARRTSQYGAAAGQTSYLPLRVNYSGVMPIIFSSAMLMFPRVILRMLPPTSWAVETLSPMFAYGRFWYLFFFGLLILLFSFFWVANQFNVTQIADDLQKRGGYVPGIRPGQPTAEFLDHTMTRITLAGGLFLTGLAIFPMLLANWFRVPMIVARFFGGTSLLIIVGVLLDTMRQIEAHLLSHHYDGFLQKGRLRSRSNRQGI